MTQPTKKQHKPSDLEIKRAREAARDRFRAAWDDLLDDLRRYEPDSDTLHKLVAVQDTIAPLLGEDETQYHDTGQNEFQTEHGRIAGGAQVPRRQRGRHDKKAVPAGYVYQHGFLAKKLDISEPEPSVLLAAKQLLVNLGAMFTVSDGERGPRSLGSIIKLLLDGATPINESVNRNAPWLDKTLTSWRGHTGGGRGPWESLLQGQLEMDAIRREEAKQQQVHGHEPLPPADVEVLGDLGEQTKTIPWGSFDRPASGEEMLAYIKYVGIEIPSALTPAVIEEMREQVGLNKGGRPAAGQRGKKTARAVVDDFAKRLKSRRS